MCSLLLTTVNHCSLLAVLNTFQAPLRASVTPESRTLVGGHHPWVLPNGTLSDLHLFQMQRAESKDPQSKRYLASAAAASQRPSEVPALASARLLQTLSASLAPSRCSREEKRLSRGPKSHSERFWPAFVSMVDVVNSFEGGLEVPIAPALTPDL